METMPAVLANTISAYATILSGLTGLIFCAFVGRQPLRWMLVYLGVLITGIPTVWFHGFGETYLAGVFDGGTNLLLGWLIILAALGDGYPRPLQLGLGIGMGLLNLAATIAKLAVGPAFARYFPVSFGQFGGFTINELVLILNSLLGVLLLYGQLGIVSHRARPLLYITTGMFTAGALLASASNHEVQFQILAFHATWHIVGAFGFLFLWAYNQVRFSGKTGLS